MVGGFIAATGISLGFFANDILFLFFTHGILTGELYCKFAHFALCKRAHAIYSNASRL